MHRVRTRLVPSVALCVALASAACGRSAEPSAPSAAAVAPPPAVAPAAAPAKPAVRYAARAPDAKPVRLPEDPVAGKRSTLQWNEHLEEEDRERQLIFDHARLKEHRALIGLITAARARCDRAKTEAALASARAAMPEQIGKIQARVAKLDPWGTGSRLLADYAALQGALSAYPAAKSAALKGDDKALQAARSQFDERLHEMREWLEYAERSEGEFERETEAEREHERELAERERER